jgi:midasin
LKSQEFFFSKRLYNQGQICQAVRLARIAFPSCCHFFIYKRPCTFSHSYCKDDQNEELDDELGDVDDDQDLLDDRLWGGEDDQDDDKKPNDEVDPEKGGELDDKGEDEYGAKQDDLPMIDKSKDEAKETENDEDDQERPDANEINENSDNDFDDKEQDDTSREQKNGDPEKPEEEMQIDMDKTGKDDQGENEDDECDPVDPSEDQDQGQDNTEAVESETEDADVKDNDDNAPNSKDYDTIERKQAGKSDQNKQDQALPMEDMDDDNEDVEDNARQDKTETTIDESMQTKNAQNSAKQERVSNKTNQTTLNDKSNEQKRQNRSKQDENRVTGDEKKLTRNKNERIVDDNNEDDDNEDGNNEDAQDFKHIKDENKKSDKQLPDSATNEQKQQLSIVDETEDENMLEDDANMSDEDEESGYRSQANIRHKDLDKQKKENERQADKDNKDTVEQFQQMDLADDNHHHHHTSLFHTNYDCLYDMDKFRLEVENKLDVLRHRTDVTATRESLELWHAYEVLTQQLSKELCEQLRLILEPTKCTKLKGDYKTGKRLNMKRVVEYIATEYRKDKIWLRRTQPNNRNYQILLAVDNSSSMADNHCMQLAYETIATLTNAFNYLQVGQFGLLSFGENVSTLHELYEPFSSDMGAKVFSQLNFNDNKTCIAQVCVNQGFLSFFFSLFCASKLISN